MHNLNCNTVEEYARHGWVLVPLSRDLTPLIKWTTEILRAPAIACRVFASKENHRGYFPNIGVNLGESGLVLVDLDIEYKDVNGDIQHPGVDGIAAWEKLKATLGFSDKGALKAETGSGGIHLIFTDPTDGELGNTTGVLAPGIDVKSGVGLWVAPPSAHPKTGGRYRWIVHNNGQPPAPLPAEIVERLRLAAQAPSKLLVPSGDSPTLIRQTRTAAESYSEAALRNETSKLANCSPGMRHTAAYSAGAALGEIIAAGGLSEHRVEQALMGAAISCGLVADDGEGDVLRTIKDGIAEGKKHPRQIPDWDDTYKPPEYTGEKIAREKTDVEQVPDLEDIVPQGAIIEITPEVAPVDYHDQLPWLPLDVVAGHLRRGDTGDAELLARLYHRRLLYDHQEDTWHLWAGHAWDQDQVELVRNLISNQVAAQYLHAERIAYENGAEDLAESLGGRGRALRYRRGKNATLREAQSLPSIADAGEDWDSNPWILGVKNGVLDLRTGELRAGRPEDRIRTVAPTPWAGIDAPAKRWEQFLQEVFAGDGELIAFLQRLLGYGITGLTIEHHFPVLWGDGRNGKDTLLEAVKATLGPLANPVDEELVASERRSSGATPELYKLRHYRLVWVNETREGARLVANRVKWLTGGGTITARDLYKPPITFRPKHLLLLATNYKPHAAADDYALWSRVLLIPFTQKFLVNPNPDAEDEHLADLYLSQKLKAETPGILAWLARGALAYQRQGLGIPDQVRDATLEYQREEDNLRRFIEDRCIVGPDAEAQAQTLFLAYKEWSEQMGIRPMSLTTFGRKMGKMYRREEREDANYYIGLTLEDARPLAIN